MKIIPCVYCQVQQSLEDYKRGRKVTGCGSFQFQDLCDGRFRPEQVPDMIATLQNFYAKEICKEPKE